MRSCLTVLFSFTLHGWGCSTLHASSSIQSLSGCTPNLSRPFMQCYFYYFFVVVFFYRAEACLMQPIKGCDLIFQSCICYFLKIFLHFLSFFLIICNMSILHVWYGPIRLGWFGVFIHFPHFFFVSQQNKKGQMSPVLVHLLTSHPFSFFPFYVLLLVTSIGEFSGVYLSMHCFFFLLLSRLLSTPQSPQLKSNA